MATFIVEYTYDPSQTERMDEIRPRHRAHLSALYDAGVIRLVGSWKEPAPGALIIVEADSSQAALEALANDPFLLSGVISKRVAHPYTIVFGELA
ncbi:MAG: YciI family protein [Actinomycetaceae bacterium]|nr:YciI family protein [Actinomycetaceae bacterium]